MEHRRTTWMLSYLLMLGVAACGRTGLAWHGVNSEVGPAGGRLIPTGGADGSAASSVWDLLKMQAHGYEYREDRYGMPLAIKTRRGASSMVLVDGDSPLLLLDGARLSDVRVLRQILTASVESVEIVSGISGTVMQGTNAGAGVIIVHSRTSLTPP